LCAWHIQQNFKKKFCYLNRNKKGESKETQNRKRILYQTITNLPFNKYEEDFEEEYENILNEEVISEEHKSYLKNKVKYKELWVKAFIKNKFCAGMCNSSRVEAKHQVLKRFLNSSSRLVKLFETFKLLESQEITKYFDEVTKFNKRNNQIISKYSLINELQKVYSPYCLNIVKNNLLEGLNYSYEKTKEGKWYLFY